MTNAMIILLAAVCITIGWVGRELTVKKYELSPAMAYGVDESTQLWNRIRVNEQGHVFCVKE